MKMPFGKYKGRELSSVPADYVSWALDNCDLSPPLRAALESRIGRAPDICRLIRDWHHRMKLRYHPDLGGTEEGMAAVDAGLVLLEELFGVVAFDK